MNLQVAKPETKTGGKAPLRAAAPSSPHKGPPKFKQRSTRQFKSKPPKRGVIGYAALKCIFLQKFISKQNIQQPNRAINACSFILLLVLERKSQEWKDSVRVSTALTFNLENLNTVKRFKGICFSFPFRHHSDLPLGSIQPSRATWARSVRHHLSHCFIQWELIYSCKHRPLLDGNDHTKAISCGWCCLSIGVFCKILNLFSLNSQAAIFTLCSCAEAAEGAGTESLVTDQQQILHSSMFLYSKKNLNKVWSFWKQCASFYACKLWRIPSASCKQPAGKPWSFKSWFKTRFFVPWIRFISEAFYCF